MGPGFVHPGNVHAPRQLVRWVHQLQWGPGLYTREMHGAPEPADRGCGVASMGPGFVHPGNFVDITGLGSVDPASMGPGFVHPGNGLGPVAAHLCPHRFNGARVCTPGKSGRAAT